LRFRRRGLAGRLLGLLCAVQEFLHPFVLHLLACL
jgi:hypothetical protein